MTQDHSAGSMEQQKARIRHEMRDRRSAVTHEFAANAAEHLSKVILTVVKELAPEGVIAGYWPINGEIDIRMALTDLDRHGYSLCLPVIGAPQTPLLFRSWQPGDPLEFGAHQTQFPSPEAPLVDPAMLLVPLVAFDKRGHRLGYGGGYYDRTIAALKRRARLITMGVAYSLQGVDKLPNGDHDQALDMIATEAGVWHRSETKLSPPQ